MKGLWIVVIVLCSIFSTIILFERPSGPYEEEVKKLFKFFLCLLPYIVFVGGMIVVMRDLLLLK